MLLTRLARVAHQRSSEDVLGLRIKPFGVLCYLRDRGPVHQQELGDVMYMDPNNLVLLLNELEGHGYVERRRDPDDRRRHIVELTDEGRRAIERGERGMESIEDEILGGLDPKERAKLRELLDRALERQP